MDRWSHSKIGCLLLGICIGIQTGEARTVWRVSNVEMLEKGGCVTPCALHVPTLYESPFTYRGSP